MTHWKRVSSETGMAVDSADLCQPLESISSVNHTTLANAILDLVYRERFSTLLRSSDTKHIATVGCPTDAAIETTMKH